MELAAPSVAPSSLARERSRRAERLPNSRAPRRVRALQRASLFAVTLLASFPCSTVSAQTTRRVSVNGVGLQSTRSFGELSRNGDYVAMLSVSPYLSGGSNWPLQAYRSALSNSETFLLSRTATGVPAIAGADEVAISGDGGTIVFSSRSPDLAGGWSGGIPILFVAADFSTDPKPLVYAPGYWIGDADSVRVSNDGRVVTFRSPYALTSPSPWSGPGVFRLDRTTGQLTAQSLTSNDVPLDYSGIPGQSLIFELYRFAMSGDGSVIAFATFLTKVTPGDPHWGSDVFVRDNETEETELISVGPTGQALVFGSFEPALSGDGRFVAFSSLSTEWLSGTPVTGVQLWLRDRHAGTTELISVNATGGLSQGSAQTYLASISHDGRFVAFATDASDLVLGDTNGVFDVFVRDRAAGKTTRVNLSTSNAQITGFPSSLAGISDDGRRVAFVTKAADVVPGDTNGNEDLFVRDLGAPWAPIAGYCSPSTSSAGCVPTIATAGEPDTSGNTAFFVTSVNAPANRLGAPAWSFGPSAPPFWSSSTCLGSPRRLLARKNSSASPSVPAACSGWFSYECTPALMFAHGWLSGAVIYAQFFVHDPAAATSLARSSALQISLY